MSIATRKTFAAAPDKVWTGLLFYEQIRERPPLLLRLLLPVPLGTEGAKAEVGDEARCLYEDGYLLKRVTRIDPGVHYGFDVAEQHLNIRGLTLSCGSYTLRPLPQGGTEVEVTTRYSSDKRPDWLWKPVEEAVCHLFHRFLFAAMRRKFEAR